VLYWHWGSYTAIFKARVLYNHTARYQPSCTCTVLQVLRHSYEYHGLNELAMFCITALAVTLVLYITQSSTKLSNVVLSCRCCGTRTSTMV
jgi:hypothetical protein